MRISGRGIVAVLMLGFSAGGCGRDEPSSGLRAITPEAFDAHFRFLSSDLLEGRAPGSLGSDAAASYIANGFRLAGLTPGIGDTSYFQPVRLVGKTAKARLLFRAPGGAAFSPEFRQEFVAWSADTADVSAAEAELVFVGYGIVAPEFAWDDYKDVDVSGKALLILAGDPGGHVAGRFLGDTATYYSLSEYKFAEATRRGATGAILVHSPASTRTWQAVLSVRAGEQMELEGSRVEPGSTYRAWLGREAAEQVASMAGFDFAELLESARSDKFRPIPTGMMVSATVENEVRRFAASNVIGMLPGSDAQLAREAVIFTAHYDHLGISEPVDGDSIYNGAYDNASGTGLLLCLADAFSRLPQRPARSVLFLAVTAEEGGMLGSRAYVEAPIVPLSRTVADINLDGVNLWGLTEDVVVAGANLSTIRSAARRAASAEGLRLRAVLTPDQGLLYRSDQFSFLKVGVPAVLVGHGLDFIGQMPGWGEQMIDEYLKTLYHSPRDEYRPNLDLRGAVQQGRVAFRLGFLLANGETRPTWRSGQRPFSVR